jgi:putative membrane protein
MTVDGGAAHAAFNASCNLVAALFIAGGWWAIRHERRGLHWRLMAGATLVSAVFLVSYLLRVYLWGTHRYPGHGLWKAIYLSILFSHMALAAFTPILVVRTIFLAWKRRLAEHRRLTRVTLPVWMYVEVTGLAVYWLLYHPPG